MTKNLWDGVLKQWVSILGYGTYPFPARGRMRNGRLGRRIWRSIPKAQASGAIRAAASSKVILLVAKAVKPITNA